MQQQVQQEAVRLSTEHKLGPLKSEHQPWNPGFLRLPRWIFYLLILFCGLISLILISLKPSAAPSIMMICMFALFLLIYCLAYRAYTYPSRHSRDFLYEQGWIRIKCKEEQIIRTHAINWRDIAIVWHVPINGDGGISHRYRLQDYHGNLLGGSSHDVLDEWPAYSEQMTLPYLFPQILSAYKQGASLSFGPLTLQKRGIEYNGKLLYWHDFGSLDLCDSSGKLSIYRRDKGYIGFSRPTWAAIPCHLVPNVALLSSLIRSISGSPDPKPGGLRVSSIPNSPVAGMAATITYHGSLIAPASSITMHWGYNNWKSITDTRMTKQRHDTWKVTIIVPSGATVLNMTFHNQSYTWDNNSFSNYNLNVS